MRRTASIPDTSLTVEQALEAMSEPRQLLSRADMLRRRFFGDETTLVSLYSVQTGYCAEDCGFCAQASVRRNATGIALRRFASPKEMLARAIAAEAAGAVEICLVASGTRLSHPLHVQSLVEGIRLIKARTRLDCAVNIGLIREEELRVIREAGADVLVHNLETARSYHPSVITTHTFEQEVETIRLGQRLGMRVQTGGILGMGETWAQRVELAFQLRELKPDAVGLSLFQPMPGTPLAHLSPLPPEEALASLALFRCVLQDTPLYLLGGRERVLGELAGEAFLAGINGTTVGDYLFTRGQAGDALAATLSSLGLRPRTY